MVTIAAPSDVAHVLQHFHATLEEIERTGLAEVTLAGRSFPISKQFVDDARGHALTNRIANLHKALLVMHSPTDQVVGIEHATKIFSAAKHPKSFVSLDSADHLLSGRRDAAYVAEVVAAWALRYFPATQEGASADTGVLVFETGVRKFQNAVIARRHHLLADEPETVGGLDSGPTPYDYLAIALGACTSMTLRIYADQRKLSVGRLSVRVNHGKVPVEHCQDCGKAVEGRTGRIDRLERVISVEGGVDAAMRDKLIEIANKCPVHRTLEAGVAVVTTVIDVAES